MKFPLSRILVVAACIFSTSLFAKHNSHRFHRARHSVDFMQGKNAFQVESYLNFETNNGQLTIAHPSLLLRYGIIDILELRLNLDCSTVQDEIANTSKTGFSSLQPGFKIRINKPKLYLPSFAFTGSVVVPMVASKDFRQTYWSPTLLLSAEQDFDKNSKYSIEYNAGLYWDADNFQRIYTASLNAEIDVTSTTTFYTDFYLFKPTQTPIDIRVDLGANYDVNRFLQFDFSLGAGLTKSAPEFFLNAGFIFSYNNLKKHLVQNDFKKSTPKRKIDN